MFKIIISTTTIISFVLLIILLNVTAPVTAGPFGILAIFFFMYLLFMGITTYFIYGASRVIAHLSTALIARKPFEVLTLKRSYYFSTIIAAAPIMLIGLQSVGSVNIYEVLLVVIFVFIGCLYISKRVN